MIESLTAPGSFPFSVALLVMLGLLVFEIVSLIFGLGVDEAVDGLIESSIDMPDDLVSGIEGSGTPAEGGSVLGRVLAWLYVGKVPVLMVLIVFLTIFALLGLIGQSILRQTVGLAVPGVIAVPVVLFISLPVVRLFTGGLARILPKDETSAVSTATFVGRTAVVTGGNASVGMPAQARLTDSFGTTHYVMVEPEDPGQALAQGSLVLLVQRINGRFTAIPNPSHALADDPEHRKSS